ncbi:hypothetical protein CsSME_00053430 [Camellia sinensis var. sinensis]
MTQRNGFPNGLEGAFVNTIARAAGRIGNTHAHHPTKVKEGLPTGGIPKDGLLSSDQWTGRKGRRQKNSAKLLDTKYQAVSTKKENIEVRQDRVKDGLHGDSTIETLQANYHYPNEAAIKTVLRYRNRDCHELLGYVPTYRYSAPCRSKVTDFLRAPSPPLDPTLPDVPFIRLTEAEEMAKRSRIKNLITATSTELPSIPTRTAVVGQSSGTMVALASPAAGQASKDNRRAGKRPRVDPSAELVAELNTEQLAVTTDPTPTWR